MTKVVNIHKEPYDVYIGRSGKGKDGYFGNRHVVGWCKFCNKCHGRDESVEAFRKDFELLIKDDPQFKQRVEELKGKILGCFCKPNRCHGDVIVEYLNK